MALAAFAIKTIEPGGIMKSALLGVAAFALASTTGCGLLGPDQSVVLGVAEIDAPVTIAPGASLSVVLTVETGGCRRFDRVETNRSESGANITVWGRDGAKGRDDIMCPQDLRTERHSVRFDPPFAPVFTVSVNQGRMPPSTITVRVQ